MFGKPVRFVDKKFTLESEIAKKFNEFFTEIDPSLARDIPTPRKPFESFLEKASPTLPEKYLTLTS